MGGQKEGGDCWGDRKRIKEERGQASGGKTRRKGAHSHLDPDYRPFPKQQVSSYLLILDAFFSSALNADEWS